MKAKIINKNESNWYSDAIYNEAILLRRLYEIGLEKPNIDECVKELRKFKNEEENRILLEKFHDPRYSGQYKEFDSFSGRNLDKNYLAEFEEFKRKNRSLAHKSDGEYANKYYESLIDKLKELLGFIEYRIESDEIIDFKLPIFKFNSPNIKGSEVSFETTNTHSEKNNCNFSILGTGIGNTKSISLSFSNTFVSCDGAYKLVFILIKLKNSLIGVYEKNKMKKQFIQSELYDYGVGEYCNIGIDNINKEEYFKSIQPIKTKFEYKLSGDTTQSKHTFKETINSSEEFTFDLGINAFELNGNCKANISRSNEVKLELKLPAGHDYVVKEIFNGFGILCEKKAINTVADSAIS